MQQMLAAYDLYRCTVVCFCDVCGYDPSDKVRKGGVVYRDPDGTVTVLCSVCWAMDPADYKTSESNVIRQDWREMLRPGNSSGKQANLRRLAHAKAVGVERDESKIVWRLDPKLAMDEAYLAMGPVALLDVCKPYVLETTPEPGFSVTTSEHNYLDTSMLQANFRPTKGNDETAQCRVC